MSVIVYKTSSQTGTNQAFESFDEYVEYQNGTQHDAHKIIDCSRVEALQGCEVEINVDGWGNIKLAVTTPDGRYNNYTITQFFAKYQY